MNRRAITVAALSASLVILAASAFGAAWLAGRVPRDHTDKTGIELVGSTTVVVDEVAISVSSVEPVDASRGIDPPKSGNRFVVLHVMVENRGIVPAETPESGTWTLKTDDGRAVDYAPVFFFEPNAPVSLAKGGRFDVRIAFEVPSAGGLVFVMEPNSLSDRAIEIPLVPRGSVSPRTDVVSTGRVRKPPVVVEAAIGRPISLTGCNLTVLSGGPWRSENPACAAAMGTRYFGVRIRVENKRSDPFGIGPDHVCLRDASGAQWGVVRMDNQASDVSDEGYVYVQPGQTEDWTIPFEIPDGAKELRFVILQGEDWSANQVEVPMER